MTNATHAYTLDGKYFGTYGERKYVGDQYLEKLLVDEAGQKISLDQAKEIHPHYTLVLAALNSEVQKLLAKRTEGALETSSKIYLSYRWESAELTRWVRRLAQHLKERGYEVEFDQDVDLNNSFFAAAHFMARMATCECVLMIRSRLYADIAVEEGQNRIGWVLDEQMLALKLRANNLIRIVYLEKENGQRAFDSILNPDEIIDIRGQQDCWSQIDRAFP